LPTKSPIPGTIRRIMACLGRQKICFEVLFRQKMEYVFKFFSIWVLRINLKIF
jgi:hypothetical protein